LQYLRKRASPQGRATWTVPTFEDFVATLANKRFVFWQHLPHCKVGKADTVFSIDNKKLILYAIHHALQAYV